MTVDQSQNTSAALKWLYEMEAIDSPVLRANLYENIFLADKKIMDCAVWITPTFTYQKGVLVWLKLNWRARWFGKEEVISKVTGVVKSLLPSYNVRIVEDMNILEMAQEKVESVYGGGNHEPKESNTANIHDNSSEVSRSKGGELPPGEASDLLPNSEEQAENQQKVRNDPKQCDLQIDEKAQSVIEDLYSDSDAGELV